MWSGPGGLLGRGSGDLRIPVASPLNGADGEQGCLVSLPLPWMGEARGERKLFRTDTPAPYRVVTTNDTQST